MQGRQGKKPGRQDKQPAPLDSSDLDTHLQAVGIGDREICVATAGRPEMAQKIGVSRRGGDAVIDNDDGAASQPGFEKLERRQGHGGPDLKGVSQFRSDTDVKF